MWLDHIGWVLIVPLLGRDAWALTLHALVYSQWTREISGDWMRGWVGRLVLETAPGWLSLCLADGPKLCGDVLMTEGTLVYAVLLASVPAEGLAGQAHLPALRVGMTTPPGLSAADRWALLPDADFSADGFLNDIATDLEVLP